MQIKLSYQYFDYEGHNPWHTRYDVTLLNLFMFQELPHEYVSPSMLAKVAQHGKTNKLYACEVTIVKAT